MQKNRLGTFPTRFIIEPFKNCMMTLKKEMTILLIISFYSS